MAHVYYNREFDLININIPTYRSEEKRALLLQFIKANQPNKKGEVFAVPFGPDKKGFRDPEDNIASRYKIKGPVNKPMADH